LGLGACQDDRAAERPRSHNRATYGLLRRIVSARSVEDDSHHALLFSNLSGTGSGEGRRPIGANLRVYLTNRSPIMLPPRVVAHCQSALPATGGCRPLSGAVCGDLEPRTASVASDRRGYAPRSSCRAPAAAASARSRPPAASY